MGNILVCGGSGKRGRTLCRKLLSTGNAVTCIDDESVGWIVEIADCLDNENFKFIRSKMENIELFDFKNKIDLVYDYLPNTSSTKAKDKIKEIAKEHNCKVITKIDKLPTRSQTR